MERKDRIEDRARAAADVEPTRRGGDILKVFSSVYLPSTSREATRPTKVFFIFGFLSALTTLENDKRPTSRAAD